MNLDILSYAKDVPSSSDSETKTQAEFKQWIKSGRFVKSWFRYGQLTYHIYDHRLLSLKAAVALAAPVWGKVRIVDRFDNENALKLSDFGRLISKFFREWLQKKSVLKSIRQELQKLEDQETEFSQLSKSKAKSALYIRSDFLFGIASGGSIGHIAGVLNNLELVSGKKPVFLTSDDIPTVNPDIEAHIVGARDDFLDFKEMSSLLYNRTLAAVAKALCYTHSFAYIYQRYSVNNWTGVQISREQGIPFILEYNGSEVWIGKNWGQSLLYENLSARIELLNLRAANVIVVVSNVLKDELIERGIEPQKILVNPNGVDPEVYSPSVDGSQIRKKYEMSEKTVFGFIGTFGKWHGAEVLAKAYAELCSENQEFTANTRLLMIGDGPTMPMVQAETSNCPQAILTGLIPQKDGPAHLAACDILVASHIPNADGTEFFGSPTKLFEYMAMGKGIIASELNQIGEILEHDKTAVLVKPGDLQELKAAMIEISKNPDKAQKLGSQARAEAEKEYSWYKHTQKIYAALSDQTENAKGEAA